MAVTDPYAGRTVDLAVFQGAAAGGEVLLDQALADPAGSVCAGAQKLAQRFLILLLTERGSMPLRPAAGCDFLTDLRQGRLRSQADVFVAFAFAVGLLRGQLLAATPAGAPDDEVFRTATLLAAAVSPGTANLRIQVVSRAGDARVVILPVPTTNF